MYWVGVKYVKYQGHTQDLVSEGVPAKQKHIGVKFDISISVKPGGGGGISG